MKITMFIETFPFSGTEIVNAKLSVPTFLDTFKSLKNELIQILGENIEYIEDVGDNFPKMGYVLYCPYSSYTPLEFLKHLNNQSRIILLNVPPYDPKKYEVDSRPGAVVSMLSLFDNRYPNDFWMVGRPDIVKDKAVSTVPLYHDFVLMDYEKFKNLPEALAWYIKELDKSGLVKE